NREPAGLPRRRGGLRRHAGLRLPAAAGRAPAHRPRDRRSPHYHRGHTRRQHRSRGCARQPDHPSRSEDNAQERVMTMFIPGSEIFSSRPIDPEELRRSLPTRLETHTVRSEKVDELDPLTYEVVRHRLWSVTDEMGEALKRMSGSPIVTDANDFDFAICDELGQEVQVGLYNTMLVGAVDLAIYWTLRHRAANPGIAEGDMF